MNLKNSLEISITYVCSSNQKRCYLLQSTINMVKSWFVKKYKKTTWRPIEKAYRLQQEKARLFIYVVTVKNKWSFTKCSGVNVQLNLEIQQFANQSEMCEVIYVKNKDNCEYLGLFCNIWSRTEHCVILQSSCLWEVLFVCLHPETRKMTKIGKLKSSEKSVYYFFLNYICTFLIT